MPAKISTETINARLAESRNNEYSLAEESRGIKTKNLIRHNVCGNTWEVIPHDVIRKVSTCPKCATAIRRNSAEAQDLLCKERGGEYILDEDTYLGVKSKCTVTHSCGHSWSTVLFDVVRGASSCPRCGKLNNKSKSGFKPNSPAILYFLCFLYHDAPVYKIGITNNTVISRHSIDRSKVELIWQINFEEGFRAKELEQLFLHRYSNSLINTGVLTSGNTETLSTYISVSEVTTAMEELYSTERIEYSVTDEPKLRVINKDLMFNYW